MPSRSKLTYKNQIIQRNDLSIEEIEQVQEESEDKDTAALLSDFISNASNKKEKNKEEEKSIQVNNNTVCGLSNIIKNSGDSVGDADEQYKQFIS